jgi:thioredoxin reductase
MSQHATDLDVAVIGAGSAGLQAALTLGRMRRRVVVFTTDTFRNDPAAHMQNFLGHDGQPPAELRRTALADIARYDSVEIREAEVTSISGSDGAFVITTADCRTVTARKVVLATGLADTLPDVPGIAEHFGDRIAHCPYCHGFELADAPLAILGAGAHAPMLAALVERLATTVTVLTDGGEVDESVTAKLEALGVGRIDQPLARVDATAQGLRLHFADGSSAEVGGMFVAPRWAQAAPFAEQLGLETAELGGVLIDVMGHTTVPGVYAAGDMAHVRELPMPMSSVLTAAAAGLMAAASADRDLMTEAHA